MNPHNFGRFFRSYTLAFKLSSFSAALLGVLVVLSTGCQREPSAQEAVAQLEKMLSAVGRHDALSFAIAAAKTNDFAIGVITLQQVKTSPGLTADQLISVEQASQAMTADLVRRADAGDAHAKASLELIAQTRSQ